MGWLAQAGGPPLDPLSGGIAVVALGACIRLIWVLISDLRERANRLEAALEVQREATLAYAETVQEMKSLGRLMRKVLEALPQADQTPPPPSRSLTRGPPR